MKLITFFNSIIKFSNTRLIKMNLPVLLNKTWFKIFIIIVSLLLGFLISAFTIFQVLFLSKVLPHGGL